MPLCCGLDEGGKCMQMYRLAGFSSMMGYTHKLAFAEISPEV